MLAGIDWASTEHAVFVEDDDGGKADAFMMRHSKAGFNKCRRRLYRHGEPGDYLVAVERPDGRLIDFLLEAGFCVVPVSPRAIRQFRFGEQPSGAKCDLVDAEMICEYLRLRRDHLRVLEPFMPETVALRVLVRCRDELVKAKTRVSNQLGANLDMFWPAPKGLFSGLDTQIAMAFLDRWPTPVEITETELAALCAARHYACRTPHQLLARIRKAAPPRRPDAECAARGRAVVVQLALLRTIVDQIAVLDNHIEAALHAHPDAATFTGLPRSGMVNAAQLLAEWGDNRDLYDTADSVGAYGGVVPVTKQSGKRRDVYFRHGCNKRLRKALTTFADNSRHASPWAAHVYDDATGRNLDHNHAIRVLGRAWTRVIFRCWQDHAAYDPDRHGRARLLAGSADVASQPAA